MGYKDDFYTKDNILGYTGTIGSNPTVYFADAGGKTPKTIKIKGKDQVLVSFGHITQAHDIATNVGRELVRECYSYSISNVMEGGTEHAQECVYGQKEMARAGVGGDLTPDGFTDFHTSRNRFEAVTGGNREMLALAIEKHKSLKKMYE